MAEHSSQQTDPLAGLRSMRPAEIRERLAALAAESRLLRMALRLTESCQRAVRPDDGGGSHG